MKLTLSALCGFLVSMNALASPESERGTNPWRPDNLKSATYPQLIDHTGKLAGQTFNQRYWVDNDFASTPDAPVLYHMCGEANVDDAYFLNDYALSWAKQLGARVVWLEHRYYGHSQPFANDTGANLAFLTLHNVMEDLATFQTWLQKSQGWTGKWIALGGSYSATMAALYRQAHPELVVGALASSAPMISGIGSTTDGGGSSDSSPSDDRSWTYQACSEVGYWTAEGPERGAPLNLPGESLCRESYGNAAPYFNADAYNKIYDIPFITNAANAPSNILFTYGSDDVWTDIGLATQQDANPSITIRMIDGAGHHFDLNADEGSSSREVTNARQAFVALAQSWLAQ